MEKFKEDIIVTLQNEELSLDNFIANIKDKNVVIFMGNTRCGKSTLVKFQLGVSLEAIESKVRMELKIQEKDVNQTQIGHGSLSCTTLPQTHLLNRSSVVLIDLPGFADNRGVVQEIANALAISQVKKARTIKFVLVFDINEIIIDNIENFTNCLQQVRALIPNYKEVQDAFCTIFTKDWRNHNRNDISELLREKIINVADLDVDKELVRMFADNPHRIGIFKMPTQVGDLSSEVNFHIDEAISTCHSIDVLNCEIKFTLSDQAQEALLQVYPEYIDTIYFDTEINKIIQRYINYFGIDKYVYASYDDELCTTKTTLELILASLERHTNEARVHLIDIKASLMELIGESLSRNFINDFKFMCVLNSASLLEDRYTTAILNNYKNSLRRLGNKIKRLIEKITAEQTDRFNENFKFAAAGVCGTAALIPTGVGLGTIADPMIKDKHFLKNITEVCKKTVSACEELIGEHCTKIVGVGAITTVAASATACYIQYKENTKKRNDYRLAQNRI